MLFLSLRISCSRILIEMSLDQETPLEKLMNMSLVPSTLNGNNTPSDTLTIIHYNDVYNVEGQAKEPIGGATRFTTAVKSFANLDPIILFSGDCFSPSLLSTITKGEQMVPVLNSINTHCAVYGNHEFDFGLDILASLVKKTTFPWLLSNVIDIETNLPLGEGKITHIIEKNGRKIGLMGLVECEWLETLSTIDPDAVTFTDYIEVGNELAHNLREQGCDLIIALTHMRSPNDLRLAENAKGIDIILGGHDHVYELKYIHGIPVLKSGTDFRDFSIITVTWTGDQMKPIHFGIERISVTSDYAEDKELKEVLDEFSKLMNSKMDEVLGEFHCDLDGRFSSVRTSETNLGNFMTDIMVACTNADCAILNSGTLRSDRIHPSGPFTRKDLLTVLPMLDSLVVLNVLGSQLVEALENSVSQYPKLEGRFPQVSGLKFAFNPKLPIGSRVDPKFVMVGDEYLQLHQHYRLVTKKYIATGHDGYTILAGAEVLADEDACLELTIAVQNHFHAIEMVSGTSHDGRRNSRHHQSLVTLSRRHSLLRSMSSCHDLSLSPIHGHVHQGGALERSYSVSPRPSLSRQGNVVETIERNTCRLLPRVEGRITIITDKEILNSLINERKEWERSRTIQEEDEQSPTTPTDKIISHLRALHTEAVLRGNSDELETSGDSGIVTEDEVEPKTSIRLQIQEPSLEEPELS